MRIGGRMKQRELKRRRLEAESQGAGRRGEKRHKYICAFFNTYENKA